MRLNILSLDSSWDKHPIHKRKEGRLVDPTRMLVISTASVLHFGRRSRDDGCPKSLVFHLAKCLFDFYNLNLFVLSVSALVSGTLDWALSACQRGERLCSKAVGQDEMQDGRRESNRGLWLMEIGQGMFLNPAKNVGVFGGGGGEV